MTVDANCKMQLRHQNGTGHDSWSFKCLGPIWYENGRVQWLSDGGLGIHLWIDNTYISLWSKFEIASEDGKVSYVNAAFWIGVFCISLLHDFSMKISYFCHFPFL